MATPFLYNGQAGVQTDSNGLLNMRARYYSPYLMRFLNADPIGFSGGSNWFAYADGNPISLSDPFGLCVDRNVCTGGTGRGGVSVPFPVWSEYSGMVHGGLDVFGLIPGAGEFADGAGALIYLAEGNKTDASIGVASMIPFAGSTATAVKAGKYVDEAKQLYEIEEGVRRSKAADILGQDTIVARIIREGESDVVQDIPLSSLRSPKDIIDTSKYDDAVRFGETLEKTRISPVGPANATKVHPGGKGTPIKDVNVKYR